MTQNLTKCPVTLKLVFWASTLDMDSSSNVTENDLVIHEHCTQLLHHSADPETVPVVIIVLCEVTNVMSPHENVCVSEAWIIPVKDSGKFYVHYTYMYTLKIIFY